MQNHFKFLTQVRRKMSQFEIVVKFLAHFNTQFKVKESFNHGVVRVKCKNFQGLVFIPNTEKLLLWVLEKIQTNV